MRPCGWFHQAKSWVGNLRIWKHITPRRLVTAVLIKLVLFWVLHRLGAGEAVYKFVRASLFRLSEFELSSSSTDCHKDCFVILWTRRNRDDHQTITDISTEGLAQTYFNRSNPTKILLHGFTDWASTSWTHSIKRAYLDRADHNVFSVDWHLLAKSPWYTTAVKNTDTVGQYTASLIWLLSRLGVPLSSVHVIGASLGAHAAAAAGKYTDGRIGRITALDPSGPLFHTVDRSERLDQSDAVFVDVIHTAGKWVGNDDVIGHADFFVNGGQAPQPGCLGQESLDLICSHFMSWRLFSESINSESGGFTALRCANEPRFRSGDCCFPGADVAVMGDAANANVVGVFFVDADGAAPYARKTAQNSTNCQWVK